MSSHSTSLTDWCIWAVTDPGRVRCATIFDAVDPDQAFHTVYAGFQVSKGQGAIGDAHEVEPAAMKAEETRMGRRFQGIIFDQARGRQTLDSKYSQTVAEQYWDCLLEAGVVPDASRGNVKGMGGFFPGLNNVEARERSLLNMMAIRIDGPFGGHGQLPRRARARCRMLDKQIAPARTDSKKNPEKPLREQAAARRLRSIAPEYLDRLEPGLPSAREGGGQYPPRGPSTDFNKKKTRSRRRELARCGYL